MISDLLNFRFSRSLIEIFYELSRPQVTIKTDDMDLAGDIIQGMATFLGIEVKCHRYEQNSFAYYVAN